MALSSHRFAEILVPMTSSTPLLLNDTNSKVWYGEPEHEDKLSERPLYKCLRLGREIHRTFAGKSYLMVGFLVAEFDPNITTINSPWVSSLTPKEPHGHQQSSQESKPSCRKANADYWSTAILKTNATISLNTIIYVVNLCSIRMIINESTILTDIQTKSAPDSCG